MPPRTYERRPGHIDRDESRRQHTTFTPDLQRQQRDKRKTRHHGGPRASTDLPAGHNPPPSEECMGRVVPVPVTDQTSRSNKSVAPFLWKKGNANGGCRTSSGGVRQQCGPPKERSESQPDPPPGSNDGNSVDTNRKGARDPTVSVVGFNTNGLSSEESHLLLSTTTGATILNKGREKRRTHIGHACWRQRSFYHLFTSGWHFCW